MREDLRALHTSPCIEPTHRDACDPSLPLVLSCRRGDAKQQIEHLLGEKSRLFTTKCVMTELRGLGKEFSGAPHPAPPVDVYRRSRNPIHSLKPPLFVHPGTRQVCKSYALHHCGHEAPVSAAECLAEQVADGNPQHFFLATQDRPLQRKVMAMPGGAVAFVSVNGLHLETPSEAQKSHAKKADDARMAPGRVERRSSALRELTEGADKEEGVAEGQVFKRKKAKGPNPLAAKPKQRKTPAVAPAPPPAAGGEVSGKPKRQRKRRKSRAEGGDGSD